MPSVFWMRACPQSDRPTQRLSSSSVVVYTGWMTETLKAGEAGAKHLDPNWWKCRDSSICQSQLHYTLLVTFLGALNIMTDHPVSSRWLHRGERFIIARCFSSTWRGREQQVEVSSESLNVITEENVDRYDVSDGAHCSVSIFSAIWLSENQVVLEGFWYNVSQVWKWQQCDGLDGTLRNKYNSLTHSHIMLVVTFFFPKVIFNVKREDMKSADQRIQFSAGSHTVLNAHFLSLRLIFYRIVFISFWQPKGCKILHAEIGYQILPHQTKKTPIMNKHGAKNTSREWDERCSGKYEMYSRLYINWYPSTHTHFLTTKDYRSLVRLTSSLEIEFFQMLTSHLY